jgi:HlyD family secretion protein
VSTLKVTVALSVLSIAACNNDSEPQEIHGTLERDRLELIAEASERIVEIPVREGERVAAAATLVVQQTDAIAARLAAAQASIVEQERRLEELERGPRKQERVSARASLAGAESSLASATREFDRIRSLVERRLLSDSDLDRARAERDAARPDRDAARASLRLLEEGTRSEQIAQAQAALDGARAVFRELETSAVRYTVYAPRSGLIEALPYEEGERPPAGAAVVVLLADGAPFARVHVPEPLRARYLPGTAVELRVDGVAAPLEGRVRFVAAQASFTPYYALTQRDRSRLAFRAEIDLFGAEAMTLPAGIPVQVRLRPATSSP